MGLLKDEDELLQEMAQAALSLQPGTPQTLEIPGSQNGGAGRAPKAPMGRELPSLTTAMDGPGLRGNPGRVP